MLMSKKINEACKNYSEIEKLKKINEFLSPFDCDKGPFVYLTVYIRKYGSQHKWGKPLNPMTIDYSIHEFEFLYLNAPERF